MYDFANSGYTTVVITAVFGAYFLGTGENLIAAFLPELADSRAMGRVSGWGWAFGYLGGLVALGICLFYLMSSGQETSRAVPVTMVITAAFFAVAAVPTFVFLRERALPQASFADPWERVMTTLRESQRYRDLRQFLLCIVFYQAGITAVVSLAAIYA